jgi:hypothetical protein
VKLKLKFIGPNVVASTTRSEAMSIGHAISFETELIEEPNDPRTYERLWNIERAFNELTKGRLHVEIVD